MERKVIYVKDVCSLLGVSRKTASERLKFCRRSLHKLPHQYVTITEFCRFYGIL